MSKVDLEDLLDSSGSDDEGDTIGDVSERSHGRLIERVKVLYGSREVKQRGEASQNVSEFGFSGERSVCLTAYDMLKDLNNTTKLKKKRNKILKIKKKAAALPVPLPKVSRERLQRAIGYAKTTSELGKWDSIVEHNESADQIYFPLNDEPIRLEQSNDFVKKFKAANDLETQVESLLSSSKHRLDKDAALTQFEEEKLKVLSKEEAIARLSELRCLRALMHSEALRNRRVRKIKSRKFHRVQRKDKIKAAIREFEQLKIVDPRKALEKLEELEQIRREERVSLRHKRKSKWAEKLAKTGKFDKEAQHALRERIELSRELKTKVKMDDEDEDEAGADEHVVVGGRTKQDDLEEAPGDRSSGDEEREKLERSLQGKDEPGDASVERNPWLRRTFFEEIKGSPASAIGASSRPLDYNIEESGKPVNGLREARHYEGRTLGTPERMRTVATQKDSNRKVLNCNKYDISDKSIGGSKSRASRKISNNSSSQNGDNTNESDVELILESTRHVDPYAFNAATTLTREQVEIEKRVKDAQEEESRMERKREIEEMVTPSAVCIDPEKALEVGEKAEKKLKSRLQLNTAIEGQSSSEEGSDDDDDDTDKQKANEKRQRKLIQEAFAGDDVVEDFIKEQKEKDALERAAEREAALKMKGLDGDWVTPNNIHRLDDRKKKFLESRRKTFQPRAAIINEEADTKAIRPFRVSDVPKGFTQISQFEAVLQQPVGSTFNTPNAFQTLTKPRIVTARGKIIRPIDHNALIKTIKDFKQDYVQRKAAK
ncbi:hypothetical protein BIW11_05946 [Tropilaelaps mercedesae]|uniref:U3 small nucleolar RNA-associated protein 14-like n=1 Tax=Tropilaelaps mercedesae TaxID=418985 RepID=A0A1V9Y0A5_9ACAR|nr:hypothetical protein BIW11_05946 [Tropilaelaps mercedesae]